MKRINALAIDWVTHDEHDGELDKKTRGAETKTSAKYIEMLKWSFNNDFKRIDNKNRGASYSSAAEPTLASSSNGAPAEPMLADKGTQEVTK